MKTRRRDMGILSGGRQSRRNTNGQKKHAPCRHGRGASRGCDRKADASTSTAETGAAGCEVQLLPAPAIVAIQAPGALCDEQSTAENPPDSKADPQLAHPTLLPDAWLFFWFWTHGTAGGCMLREFLHTARAAFLLCNTLQPSGTGKDHLWQHRGSAENPFQLLPWQGTLRKTALLSHP